MCELCHLNVDILFMFRLCESEGSVKELGLNKETPAWVDMLIKCRLLGRNSEGILFSVCDLVIMFGDSGREKGFLSRLATYSTNRTHEAFWF